MPSRLVRRWTMLDRMNAINIYRYPRSQDFDHLEDQSLECRITWYLEATPRCWIRDQDFG